MITDLINEAIDECKYQISYANDHSTEKKQENTLPPLESSEGAEIMNA